MVSSKCCQGVSPSPFRFLAALIPPWAHTECERLTGTMEKRSTLPPASAILMTAASPASPPPTTMILGFVAINQFPVPVSCSLSPARASTTRRLFPRLRWWIVFWAGAEECGERRQTHCNEQYCDRGAEYAEAPPRLFTDGDAPFRAEQ